MTEIRTQPRRRVAELMTSPPLVVGPAESVAAAARLLHEHSVGAVLVGTPEDIVGILSERDVVDVVASGADPALVHVRTAMTSPVIQLRGDDTVLEAAVDVLDLGIRHLPVAGPDGVEGVVSLRDLVRPLLLEALTSSS